MNADAKVFGNLAMQLREALERIPSATWFRPEGGGLNSAGPILEEIAKFMEQGHKANVAVDAYVRNQIQRYRKKASEGRPDLALGELAPILALTQVKLLPEREASKTIALMQQWKAPPLELADAYGAMASILQRFGRIAEAKSYVSKCVELLEKHDATPLKLAIAYAVLGGILGDEKRNQEAISYYERAFTLAQRGDPYGKVSVQCKVAIAEHSDCDEASRWDDACEAAMRYILSRNTARDQLAASQDTAYAFRNAMIWAAKKAELVKVGGQVAAVKQHRVADGMRWMVQSRGVALTVGLVRRMAGGAAHQARSSLERRRQELQAQLGEAPKATRLELLRELTSTNEQLAKVLDEEYAHARNLIQPSTTFEDLARDIPSKTVCIFLESIGPIILGAMLSQLGNFRCPSGVHSFCVTPDESDRRDSARGWFESRLESAVGSPERGTTVLLEIRDILFDELAKNLIGDAARVILCPSGGLSSIPFEGMTFGDKRMDSEKVVSRAASLNAVWLFRRSPPKTFHRDVLAIGINNYSGATIEHRSHISVDGYSLPSLVWAEDEARSVAEGYGSDPLLGSKATRSEVLARLPTCSVLHASVHGIIRHDDPLASYLALSPVTEESGRLSADEIFGMDLSSLELAILSVCSSEGTDVQTELEGPLGLPFSLLRAGVRAVVAAIRPVYDDLARDMMLYLHARLRDGDTLYGAMRATKSAAELGEFGELGQDVRNSSAFVIHGDPMMRLPGGLRNLRRM